MTEFTQKISQLPEIVYPNENFSLPIATNEAATASTTYRSSLNEIRSVLLFENAYSTIADGLAGTAKGDKFFVYTDSTKDFVAGWVNAGNSATALVDNNGVQLVWGTIYSIKKGGGPTVAQWIYNGGYAKGGETTLTPTVPNGLTVVEVYVNGDRQFKDQGFSVDSSNAITLASELELNDLVVVIMSSSDVTLEDLNTTLLALFSGSTGAAQIGVTGGGTLQSTLDNIGVIYPSVQTVLTGIVTVSTFRVRGFYSADDGGTGVWISTGVVNVTNAGTHIPNQAKIYDKVGNEFQLSLENSTLIDPKCNGAKEVTIRTDAYSVKMEEIFPNDDDSFICIGEVINGIQSLYEDIYYNVNANSEVVPSFNKVITFNFGGKSYRLGRSSINVRSRHRYDLNGGTIYNWGSANNRKNGTLLDTFSHGALEIQRKYALVGGDGTNTPSWSSVSVQKLEICNGYLYGDQHPDLTKVSCTSRMGIFLLNPEYFILRNLTVEGFLIPIYTDQINRTTTDLTTPLSLSNTYSIVSGVPQHGNFYGGIYENIVCNRGRLALVYSRTDWTKWTGGNIADNYLWGYSGDEIKPDYFLVQSGSGFEISGCNLTVIHGDISTERWQPAQGVAYIDGNGVSIHNNYLEHTPNLIRLSKNSVVHQTSSVLGNFHLDTIAAQYRPVASWNYVKFDPGCFGYYDTNGDYQFPTEWVNNYTPFSGINFFRIGSPSHDSGAFPHGGYDFKYGPYNIEYYDGLPDIDHLRDIKRAKEFLTPYGLQVNAGNMMFPVISPAFGSNICIWLKDLTGNFDASKIVLWNAANVESGASITDTNTFMATGQVIVDYNNGYKLVSLQNLRPTFDGVQNWGPSGSLYIQVDQSTPIILKSIQAFTGGIPFFPPGLEYTPRSNLGRIWGSQPSTSQNATTGARLVGGGLFRVGDIVEPWKRINRSTGLINPAVDEINFPSNISTKIVTGGCGLGGQMQKSFTVTITAIDTVNNTTTVNIDDSSMLTFVMAGMLIHFTGVTTGSTAITAGDFRILERVTYTSSSTNNKWYIIDGNRGAVGDILSVDQSKVGTYTFSGSSLTSTGIGLNFNTGNTSGAGISFYADGSSVETASIKQGYNGIPLYLSNGGHQFAGDVILNNNLGFKGSVTGTGYAVTLSVTGSTATSGDLTLRSGSFLPYATNTTLLGKPSSAWKSLSVIGWNLDINGLVPTLTSSYNIGSSSLTINNIYSQNAVTVVSDETLKDDIQELTDTEIACAVACGKLYRRYKLKTAIAEKGEDGARYHIGTIAQYIVQCFTDHNLDWTKYGIITYESWEATEAVTDGEGNVITPAQSGGEIYMVRYDELNSFINAGQQSRLDKLEALLNYGS